MPGDNVKTLDQEIVRLCKSYFNKVEPSQIATVTRVHSDSVDVKLDRGEDGFLPFENVPCLKPVYGTGELNISIGDSVMLVFEGGVLSAPYVLGKI